MPSTAPRIQVTGAKELRKALRRMGDDLSDMKAIHKAAADKVADRARERVPIRSGKLRGTIRSTASKRRAGVSAGRKLVPYAGPIHFGWPAHNISPQPFLYEALDDRRSAVVNLYVERVGQLVERVGRETP